MTTLEISKIIIDIELFPQLIIFKKSLSILILIKSKNKLHSTIRASIILKNKRKAKTKIDLIEKQMPSEKILLVHQIQKIRIKKN